MGIIKSKAKRLLDAERENARLRSKTAKQQEMLEFLGIINDIDIEELMDESAENTEEVEVNG